MVGNFFGLQEAHTIVSSNAVTHRQKHYTDPEPETTKDPDETKGTKPGISEHPGAA